MATGDPYMGRPGKSEVRGYMRATDLNGEAAAAATDLDEEPAPEELDSASRGEQGQQGELADQRDTGDLVEEQQESVGVVLRRDRPRLSRPRLSGGH